jgi:outer membrane biosynthesis protein TonB
MSEQDAFHPVEAVRSSANFLFKRKYGRYFKLMLLLSLFGHIAFILGMPAVVPELAVQQQNSMEAVDLPPEVVIPPPPRPLSKPSIPQMAQEEIDEEITIDETTPPPPALFGEIPGDEGGNGDGTGDFLTVAEVKPKIKYLPPKPRMPQYIANSRVNLVTVIEFFVTETGDVDPRTRIAESSGFPQLDEIAIEWALQLKFFPALNRGEPVAVRASISVNWDSR